MQHQRVTVINKLGLHARASVKLINLVSRFQSTILLSRADQTVDAKSIMGIMMLAAGEGTELTITTDGSDEGEAIEELSALIESGFNES